MRRLCFILTVLVVTLPAGAGAELVLRDGSRLAGVDLETKQGQYLLTLESGAVLPVPFELVVELVLTGDDDPPATGLREAEPETLVGPPGGGPELPRRSEQLEALGEQTPTIAADVVEPKWQPQENWPNRRTSNDFHPVEWSLGVFDPVWTPKSAFRESGDVTEFNPVHWYDSGIDHVWWPRDAFAETTWFPPVAAPR